MAGFLDSMFPSNLKAKDDIENKRKAGKPIEGKEMDSNHQAALKALTKNDSPSSALEDEEKRRAKILGATK